MLLREVPYRGKKKIAHFFEDRVEFAGKTVYYRDVSTLTTNASSTIHTYVGIPMGRSFTGGAQFKLNSGKTVAINMGAATIFGIPILFRSPRKSEKLYPALFEALYNIVARNMAIPLINSISSGNTVEVGGLAINSAEAVKAKARDREKAKAKGKDSKKNPVINKGNYRESQLANNSAAIVYDKAGDILWHSSVWNNKNTLLIPHILDAVFGTRDEKE